MQFLKCSRFLLAILVIAGTIAALKGDRTAAAKPPQPPQPPLPSYSIQVLELLPGQSYSEALGMNDLGDVVGHPRAWLSPVDDDGVRQPTVDLNDLLDISDEYDAAGNLTSGYWKDLGRATDINNWGQIVGSGHNWTSPDERVFRYTPADISPSGFPVFEDIGVYSGYHEAINDDGDIAGTITPLGFHGFHWTDEGVYTDLGAPPGGSFTMVGSINDRSSSRSQVCGTSGINGGQRFAFRWTSPGATAPAVMEQLVPSKTSGNSTGWAINNSGHVVGEYWKGWDVVAFRYTTKVENLGNLGGSDTRAYAINSAGNVAGHAGRRNGARTIFLYTNALGMIDIEPRIVGLPPNLQNRLARGVTPYHVPVHMNDAGQIAATTVDRIAYVLTQLP